VARQITAELGELCTVAVNCRLAPVSTTALFGEISIEARDLPPLLPDDCGGVPALEVCIAPWQAVMQTANAARSMRFTT
jgi:hypothetical protein